MDIQLAKVSVDVVTGPRLMLSFLTPDKRKFRILLDMEASAQLTIGMKKAVAAMEKMSSGYTAQHQQSKPVP